MQKPIIDPHYIASLISDDLEDTMRPCSACGKMFLSGELDNRYSFGVYAGKYCSDKCWRNSGYRDANDYDAKFDPADAGESMDAEPGVGPQLDEW